MMDVVALGECLIDFTPDGVNGLGAPLYACNPGGAPANVLAMYNKLGGKTAFIGKVGRDGFGDFLENTLRGAGIDVSGLRRSADVHTLNGAQYGQLLISRPDDPMVCHRAIEYLKERGLTVEEVRA